ncbi:MAG TPA: hypothetical protein VK063_07720, partial [Beutenbergiaceae bacterium]|nr:hypothetical protein [Beutenbergiaceae bacterium]
MARGSHRRGPRRRRTRRERSSGGGYLPDYFGPGARRRGTAPEPYSGVGEHSSGRGKRRPRPVIPDWARGRGAGHSFDPHAGHSPGTRREDRRRFLVGDILAALSGVALFVVVLAAVLTVVWLVARAVSSAPSVDEPAPDAFPVVWRFDAPELDPTEASPARLRTVDDASHIRPGQATVIAAEGAWVVLVEHGEHRAVLGLDPRTGAMRWQRDLPGAQCSLRPGPQDTVVCLAPDPDDQWTGYVLAASTGEVVDSWPVPVTRVWSLQATDTSLVLLTESAPQVLDRLLVLDLAGGAQIGSVDLSADPESEPLLTQHHIDGAEHTVAIFPQWGDLGANTVLTSGRHSIVVHAKTATIQPLDCNPLLVADGHLACGGPWGTTTMYDGEGEQVWTSPQVQLARPSEAGAQVPVNVADSRIWRTDWDSGQAIDRGPRTQAYPLATGT